MPYRRARPAACSAVAAGRVLADSPKRRCRSSPTSLPAGFSTVQTIRTVSYQHFRRVIEQACYRTRTSVRSQMTHCDQEAPMILDRPSSVDDTIGALLGDPAIGRLITAHRVMEPQPPRYAPWPDGLDPRLVNALRGRGFEALYTHQAAAVESVRAGRNVCVVTPTASGKTLCYNLPVLDAVARDDPAARALYLFPTKALAADQLVELRALAEAADIRSRRTPTTATRQPPSAAWCAARARWPSPTRTCSTRRSFRTTPSGSSCSRTCSSSSSTSCTPTAGSSAATSPT